MDFFEPQTMDGDTLRMLEGLVEESFKLKAEVNAANEVLKEKKALLSQAEDKIISYLEHYNKKDFLGESGKVSITKSYYPSVPSDARNRELFFNYLKDKGLFESFITVNPSRIKAYYNEEREKSGDPNFAIPGLTPFERKKLNRTKRRT